MRASVASLSRKLISTFFAATLALGLVPAAAFAENPETNEDVASVVSTEAGDSDRGGEISTDSELTDDNAAIGEDSNSSIPAAMERVNEDVALEPIAQQESTRSYFLAQTLESTRTVPMVSAQLPVDKGTLDEAGVPAEGDSADGEGGEDSDESDLDNVVAVESTVVGSFTYRGITYAIEPGGDSAAVVAADQNKLPADFVEAATIVLPSMVSLDGIDYYSVARVTDGAFAGLADISAITVPASVVNIETDAFESFETLQYIIVSSDNPNYSMYDGCLYDVDQTSLLLIPEGRLGTVRIAPSATELDLEVFSHCPLVDTLVADADSAAYQLLEENVVLDDQNMNIRSSDQTDGLVLTAQYDANDSLIDSKASDGETVYQLCSDELNTEEQDPTLTHTVEVAVVRMAASGKKTYDVARSSSASLMSEMSMDERSVNLSDFRTTRISIGTGSYNFWFETVKLNEATGQYQSFPLYYRVTAYENGALQGLFDGEPVFCNADDDGDGKAGFQVDRTGGWWLFPDETTGATRYTEIAFARDNNYTSLLDMYFQPRNGGGYYVYPGYTSLSGTSERAANSTRFLTGANGTGAIYVRVAPQQFTLTLNPILPPAYPAYTKTVTYNEKPANVEVPTRAGYDFMGYCTYADATDDDYNRTDYLWFNHKGEYVKKKTTVDYYGEQVGARWDKPSETTLYAKWRPHISVEVTPKIPFIATPFAQSSDTPTVGATSVAAGQSFTMANIAKWRAPSSSQSAHSFIIYCGPLQGSCYQVFLNAGVAGYVISAGYRNSEDSSKPDATNLQDTRTIYCKAVGNQYKVTFDRKSGTTGDTEKNVTFNEAVSDVAVPARSGYDFLGYYAELNADGTGKGDVWFDATGKYVKQKTSTNYEGQKTGTVWDTAGNQILYAAWRPYISVEVTPKIPFIATPFAQGSQTPAVGATSVAAGQSFTMANISSWQAPTASQNMKSFLLNCGPLQGRYYQVFLDSNALGYAISAGYKNPGDSTKPDSAIAQTTRTIYCKAVGNQYKVTFDRKSGTSGDTEKPVTFNETVSDVAVPTRSGYDFLGYYADLNADGTGKGDVWFDAAGKYVKQKTSAYYEGQKTGAVWDTADNKVLYAAWSPRLHTITWNAQGGNVSPTSDMTAQLEEADLKVPETTYRGYAFAGWWTDPTGGQQVGQGQAISQVEARNAEYFAHWVKKNGKVTLKSGDSNARFDENDIKAFNEASGNPTALLVNHTEIQITYTVDTEIFSLDGLRPAFLGAQFNGWNPSYDESGFAWNTSDESWADATYTAIWTTNVYPINYQYKNQDDIDLVGCTTEDGSKLPASFNEATTNRSLPNMFKRGYEWKGWTCMDTAGNVIEEDATAIPDVSKEIVLVGRFTAKSYPIEVKLDGGKQIGWHEEAFGPTYDDPILVLPPNDDQIRKPGHVFQHFKAYKDDSTESVTVYGRDEAGEYTKPVTELLPGSSYKVLGLGSGDGIYDVSSIEAVWAIRVAIDVPESVPLSIVADTTNDTLRFRDGFKAYAGETADEYAPVVFTSYTTAPVGIVEVADATDDAGAGDRANLLERIFRGGQGLVTMSLSADKSLKNRLSFASSTSLEMGAKYLDGLKIAKADVDANKPTTTTFWLGMDFGGLKAADLASGLSGNVAKLYYTVALLNDDDSLASDGKPLASYDDKGVLWK